MALGDVLEAEVIDSIIVSSGLADVVVCFVKLLVILRGVIMSFRKLIGSNHSQFDWNVDEPPSSPECCCLDFFSSFRKVSRRFLHFVLAASPEIERSP